MPGRCRCTKKLRPSVLVLLQGHLLLGGKRASSAAAGCRDARRSGGRAGLLSAALAAALWESRERTALLWSCCCTGRAEGRSALASATRRLSTNLIDNSSRILNRSSLLCCCLLGNLEKGGNFPSVHATRLNGPLYCWNSMAPLARQAGDTYFLGDISQASFILGWRMSVVFLENRVCFQELTWCALLLLHNKVIAFGGLHSSQMSGILLCHFDSCS